MSAVETKIVSEENHLLGEKVILHQPQDGYRVSIDAVLLAAAVDAKPGELVLDAGCGVGAASLCLLTRCKELAVIGVDREETFLQLADKNRQANGMEERWQVVAADVFEWRPVTGVQHVMCNPPYYHAAATDLSPNALKRAAHASEHGLADWVRRLAKFVPSKGSLTLVQKADTMATIIQAMGEQFGSIEIYPLIPKVGQAAHRVVIRAVKGSKSGSVLHPPLVMHTQDDKYTPQAAAVLIDGQGLKSVLK